MKKLILTTFLLLVCFVNYSQDTDEKAKELINQENYQGAINELNQVIKQNDTYSYYYYLRGYSYSQLGNLFNAKKDFLKSDDLGANPADAVYNKLATIYFGEEDWTNAVVYYKKELEALGGSDIFALFNIATSYYNSEQYKLAITSYTNVISMNSNEKLVAFSYLQRGKAKNTLKNNSGCTDVTKALDLYMDALWENKEWGLSAPVDYAYNSYCQSKKTNNIYFKSWKKASKRYYKNLSKNLN